MFVYFNSRIFFTVNTEYLNVQFRSDSAAHYYADEVL